MFFLSLQRKNNGVRATRFTKYTRQGGQVPVKSALPQLNALHSSLSCPGETGEQEGLTLHNDGGQAG